MMVIKIPYSYKNPQQIPSVLRNFLKPSPNISKYPLQAEKQEALKFKMQGLCTYIHKHVRCGRYFTAVPLCRDG